MNNPNAGPRRTDETFSSSEWDSLSTVEFNGVNEPSAETPTSKIIKTGEVSQIIEDENGKQIIESKYDLKEQSEQNDYDKEILSFISKDAASLDLCEDFVKQLSETGHNNFYIRK